LIFETQNKSPTVLAKIHSKNQDIKQLNKTWH